MRILNMLSRVFSRRARTPTIARSHQIDVFRSCLWGVKIGSAFDLALLEGLKLKKPVYPGTFQVTSLGLSLHVKEGCLHTFSVDVHKDKCCQQWSWSCAGKALSLSISRHTTPAEMVALLGPESEGWNDGVDESKTFRLPHATLECVWSAEGRRHLSYLDWSAP